MKEKSNKVKNPGAATAEDASDAAILQKNDELQEFLGAHPTHVWTL